MNRYWVSEETISQGHILYHVMHDGRSLGTFTTRELAQGHLKLITTPCAICEQPNDVGDICER